MPLKHPFLITCVVVAATATVRSQTNPPLSPAAPAPSPIFADTPRPPAPKPVPAPAPATPAKAAAISPFVLEMPKPVAPVPNGDAAEHPAEIDLSALRYFASQNDLGRVSAEIRLLRSEHPDWEPPPDLFSEAGGGPEEQALWALFARHDLAAVHARMEEIRAGRPDWQPSSDLGSKLALAEAHDALVMASDARQWGSVIDVASSSPKLLTCGDVEALWRTAEALVRTGDEPRAVAAYRYVLSTCAPADVRLATVQKASLLLASPDALDGLIQMGRRAPDGRGEFEQVRLDRLRRKIGEATAGSMTALPTPQEIDAVAASAAGPNGQPDAQLLGWYARSRKDYPGAERWFRTALAAGPNAKAAEGLVLTLRDAGDEAQARKLAAQYAGLDPLNRKLMVELQSAGLDDAKATPLSSEEFVALTRATDDLKSSDSAQAVAWHLYKANDVAGAEGWFRKSMGWMANESAAVGLVVAARRLHHDKESLARIAEYRATYPHVAELEAVMRSRAPAQPAGHAQAQRGNGRVTRVARAGRRPAADAGGGWDKSADAILSAYNGGQYDSAVAMLEQRRQKRVEPRGLSVIRGWAMYHKGDWEGAKQVFSELDKGGYSRERQEGLRVIQEGYTPPRLR